MRSIQKSAENANKDSLIWSDEFDGKGIPDPNKWDRPEYNRRNNDKGPDGWWSKQDSYLDGNGNLVIRVRKIPNKNSDSDEFDYSVGAVRTKGKFQALYGKFEIRCKLPTQPGWWVAFWMMQGNVGSVANGGVDGSELDIMEGFGWTDKINQAIHWNGYGTEHKSTGFNKIYSGIRKGFHTYTLLWTPEIYTFYIDGKESWRTTGGGVCNQMGYIKVTGEISTEDWAINQYWSNNPANAQYPDSFIVDYVRVYELENNNPNTGFNEIPSGKFQMFPNPANGEARISIFNPKYQQIKISVFSTDGKLVKVISDNNFDVGQQDFSFGNNISPGIYFVSVNTNEFREVKKLILYRN